MLLRTTSLAKNGQTYVIRYTPGCENEAVDKIMRLADDASTDLDWMDAAMMGFQVAQNAAVDCCDALKAFPKNET